MVNAVEPRRRSSDQIVDTIYDARLKEMELQNPAALSLVRRLLRDSVVFPMTAPTRYDKPLQPTT